MDIIEQIVFCQYCNINFEKLLKAGKLVTGEADPDIRRAALNLSCAVVSLPNCPQEMLQVVPRLLECLLEILKVIHKGYTFSKYFPGKNIHKN